MKFRGVGLTVAGLAVLAISGCRNNAVEPVTQARAAISVAAAPVVGTDEPVTIEATGSFQADESSDVAPEASGRRRRHAGRRRAACPSGRGARSPAGCGRRPPARRSAAAVARAEANVKLAESQNELAQTTAQRYASLLATGDVSRTVADQARTEAETSIQNVNTARASLAQARAQLALAEKAVSDVVVAAPFAGFISERKVSLGEYVQPSTAVVTLLKIDPLRLQLRIPGVQAGADRRGSGRHGDGRRVPGQIVRGTRRPRSTRRSRRSRARSSSRPGCQTRRRCSSRACSRSRRSIRDEPQRVLLVPRRAVVEDVNTNSYRVFVVDKDNRARLRVVQLAARQQGDTIRLLGGVQQERTGGD